MLMDNFEDTLSDLGYEVSFVTDSSSAKEADLEVFIGQVNSRKDYKYDVHDYGHKGYAITALDETKNPKIVEQSPSLFPYLKGRTKANEITDKNRKSVYKVVDNKNGTYTVIAEAVPNLQPYQPPEFIEIKNMKTKDFTLTLYKCDFFESTTIIDSENALKRVNAPK